MKTRNIIFSCIAGISLLVATGCENRLNIPKHGNMGTQDDFYKTDQQLTEAAVSMYSAWSGTYYGMFLGLNLLSDDVWCGGGSRGDNMSMEMLNEFTFGNDNGMVEGMFTAPYSVIYYANLIISKAEADTPVKARVIAEAKFFRAWSYFYLVSLFKTAPLVDHPLEASEYHQPNSTPEKLWALIEKDLTEAIAADVLPSKTGKNDAETGIRITKEVAQAMLGKAYLWQGKYAEAAAILDEVIESEKYDLFSGDLDKLGHAANNNCCESMLECQKRNDPEQKWAQMTMTYIMIGWRSDLLNTEGTAKEEIATGTYGFCNPRKGLYDAFVAAGEENSTRRKATLRTAAEMETYGVTMQAGKKWSGNEGYYNWKQRVLKEDCVEDASYFQALQYTGLRYMRYAEVLLLAAEAHVQGSVDQTKADKYFNKVHQRAGMPAKSSVTLDDIKTEKRLELCFECVRFMDLIRWGDAENALKDQGKVIWELTDEGAVRNATLDNPNAGFKPKHNVLPIPRKEKELNPNIEQNEGWR